MKKKIIKILNLITWSNLSILGQNKFIQSSYFWFAFVPIVAKALNGINKTLTFVIINQELKVNLSLPFSWKLLFFGSLFFSIGNLIYLIYCPQLIKKYKSFNDFESEGRTERELLILLVEIVNKFTNENKYKFAIKDSDLVKCVAYNLRGLHNNIKQENGHLLAQYYNTTQSIKEISKSINDYLYQPSITIFNKSSTFWSIRELLNNVNTIPRVLVSILYLIGLVFTAIILFNNIYAVINIL